jgi:hypothetical protein
VHDDIRTDALDSLRDAVPKQVENERIRSSSLQDRRFRGRRRCCDDVVAATHEFWDQMPTDDTGSTCEEDLHLAPPVSVT